MYSGRLLVSSLPLELDALGSAEVALQPIIKTFKQTRRKHKSGNGKTEIHTCGGTCLVSLEQMNIRVNLHKYIHTRENACTLCIISFMCAHTIAYTQFTQ